MENKNEKISIDFNRSSLFWLLIGVFVIAVLFSSYFFN